MLGQLRAREADDVSVEPLDVNESAQFHHLIGQPYRSVVDRLPEHPHHLAHAVRVGDDPAGLLLGFYDSSESIGAIVSLQVETAYRRTGLATALVDSFAQRIAAIGGTRLMFETWFDPEQPRSAGRQFLLNNGWHAQPRLAVMYQFDVENRREILSLPWARRGMPKRYSLCPWTELSESQSNRIRQRSQQLAREDPGFLSPYIKETVEPKSSLTAWSGNEPIGWGINTSPHPTLVTFKSWYVTSDTRGRGAFLGMLARSIALTAEPGSRIKHGSFIVVRDNPVMTALSKRLFKQVGATRKEKFRWFREIR